VTSNKEYFLFGTQNLTSQTSQQQEMFTTVMTSTKLNTQACKNYTFILLACSNFHGTLDLNEVRWNCTTALFKPRVLQLDQLPCSITSSKKLAQITMLLTILKAYLWK
jgi:hypothetical protein